MTVALEADDRLSEALDLIEVRASMSHGLAHTGPWQLRVALDEPLALIAVVRGRARLDTDGLDAPIDLKAGDVALLNGRSWLGLRSVGAGSTPPEVACGQWPDRVSLFDVDVDVDDADVVIGVRVDLDRAGRALLVQALPPVGHVRASAPTSANLRCSLDRLFEETASERPGSEFAIRQYSQLLVLNVLRAYLLQTLLPPGWLRLIADERLRPALTLMHADPAARWTLEWLARAALMSRTSFAANFRAVAGMPPLTYLTQWRMLLAQRALRETAVLVSELGAELGYASESAFSKAFKREVGESPLQYRYRVRTGSSADDQVTSARSALAP